MNQSSPSQIRRSMHAFVLACALVGSAAADVDIELMGITVNPSSPNKLYHPGDSVPVVAEIANVGDERAEGFTADVYAGEYHIGSDSFTSETLFWVVCSLPSDMPPGEYSVQMEISCSGDTNPGNNSASDSSGITVGALASDLWLASVDITATSLVHPGESISIECRVRNVGDAVSLNYTADFYIGSYYLGSVERGPLGIDEEDIFSETWELTEDVPEGYYSPRVTITCANDDDSRGGTNSTSDMGRFRFARRVSPDISIRTVDAADGVYQPGESMAVYVCIDAVGGQLAANCEISVFASADLAISADDYRIQNTTFSGLAPGTSYCADIICQFPIDMPLGKYYIGILATHQTPTDTETKEGQDSRPVYIGEPADLIVQAVETNGGTYSPDDQIEVRSLVENIGRQTSNDYTVTYYVSTDNAIAATDFEIGRAHHAGLAADEENSHTTTCHLPKNLSVGAYYVGMIVTCSNDAYPENNTGRDNSAIRIVQPTDAVTGRLMYQDRDGGEHPIRYALVEICDGDTEQTLKTTYTDGNGNYSVRVPGDGQMAQDVYVGVYTEGVSGAYPDVASSICSVRDDVFGEPYHLQSDLYANPDDSALTVDMCAPNSGGEFMVFDSIVEGFCKAREFFDVELKEVAVFWPSDGEQSYYDPCAVEIHLAQGDRGDRDVIMHEYGHYLTHTYDFAKGEVGDNGIHYWNADLRSHPIYRKNEHARNLAFRESWASLFSVGTQYGDTGYPHTGDTVYNDLDEESEWMLEADLNADGGDQRYWPGEYFENMNACALWDFFDDTDRGDGHIDKVSDPGMERIWLLSRHYKIDDILQFWDRWCENYGYSAHMMYIFRAYQLPYSDPGFSLPPDRPPVADAGEDQVVYQTCEGGAWVTVSGSGYDPDGDTVVCRWSADAAYRTRSPDGTKMTALFSVGTTRATFRVRDEQYIHQVADEVDITVIATAPETWTESCF